MPWPCCAAWEQVRVMQSREECGQGLWVGKGQEQGRTGCPGAASPLPSLQHSERHKRNQICRAGHQKCL